MAKVVQDRGGYATILFALSFVLAIVIIGATHDVNRHYAFQKKMQHAANVAVVSTARNATNPN
ncbi:MAG: pilus assembly protein TadG-related protein, partial [Pseudomonadota bacterium]